MAFNEDYEPYYPWYDTSQRWGGIQHSNEQVPYYMAYPLTLHMQAEDEDDSDMDKVKQMFPVIAREIQPLVEEECDKMEYDGSLMFDAYPDRLMMDSIVQRVHDQVKAAEKTPLVQEESMDDEIFATSNRRGNDLLRDLVSVMLFQEMHRRRCRHRRCKRWW